MTSDSKRRILLVTFSRNANYGGTLQEFALYKYLTNLGYEVKCLDYVNLLTRANSRVIRTAFIPAVALVIRNLLFLRSTSPAQDKKHKLSNGGLKYYIHEGVNLLKVFISDIINYKSRKKQILSYKHFWENYVTYTQPYTEKELFSSAPSYFDVYLAGSDQIWNPVKFGLSKVYYLCFAPPDIPKISYAPSFANFHFLNNSLSNIIIGYLNDYKAISVREAHSCHELKGLGIDAQHVVDPTFLLTKDDWIHALGITISNPDVPYLLVYSMNNHKKVYEYAIKAACTLSLKVKIIGNLHGIRPTSDIVCIPDAGPREFVELFLNASFVITNSFHGTALSVNFNIPFVCVESHLPERIVSLLNLTDLISRLRSFQNTGVEIQTSDMFIDFTRSNDVLACERDTSFRFLNKAIKGV